MFYEEILEKEVKRVLTDNEFESENSRLLKKVALSYGKLCKLFPNDADFKIYYDNIKKSINNKKGGGIGE